MSERVFFRLRFPPDAALPLVTNQGQYQICELAEGGLRIACAERCDLRIGQLLTGIVTFHDGSQVEIKGHAQRKDHRELVVTQLEGIAFEQMMREQQFIIQNYATPAPMPSTPMPSVIESAQPQ